MELEDKVQEQILSSSPEQQPSGAAIEPDESPAPASQPEPEPTTTSAAREEDNYAAASSQDTRVQADAETQSQQDEPAQAAAGYWYEQIPPHEFQRIKAQYWRETIPTVAKEIGMDQTELVSMLTALGIDSPDLITDLRRTIASIDAEKKRVTEDNVTVKESARKVDNFETIRGKSWYEIAEIIKMRRGIK